MTDRQIRELADKYAEEREAGMAPCDRDDAYSDAMWVLLWLCKKYCIVPKEVLDKDFAQMAAAYAMSLDPDNKANREMIEVDCLGYLNLLLEKYCLVEKEKVKAVYENLKSQILSPYKGRIYLDELFADLFGSDLFTDKTENQ